MSNVNWASIPISNWYIKYDWQTNNSFLLLDNNKTIYSFITYCHNANRKEVRNVYIKRKYLLTYHKLSDLNFLSDYETIPIFDITGARYPETVVKTGRTTGTRFGYLIENRLDYLNIVDPWQEKHCSLRNLFIVEDKDENLPFFRSGDSGSAVMVLREQTPDQALGIGIAFSTDFPKTRTLVCQIDDVLRILDMKLVRYNIWKGWVFKKKHIKNRKLVLNN